MLPLSNDLVAVEVAYRRQELARDYRDSRSGSLWWADWRRKHSRRSTKARPVVAAGRPALP